MFFRLEDTFNFLDILSGQLERRLETGHQRQVDKKGLYEKCWGNRKLVLNLWSQLCDGISHCDVHLMDLQYPCPRLRPPIEPMLTGGMEIDRMSHPAEVARQEAAEVRLTEFLLGPDTSNHFYKQIQQQLITCF